MKTLLTIERRLGSLGTQFAQIAVRLSGVEEELHDLNVKIRVSNKDLIRIQETREDPIERVQKLESTPTA